MSKLYYVNGNTVREMERVPQRERKSPQEIERDRRKISRQKAARRNRQKALSMSRGHVAFLSICVIISAFAAASLIQIQSQMTERMRNVALLERQITDLKADNDARYKEITTSVDLNEVKDIAMNQLGMQYATEEQVIYYSVDNANYMDQYSDIPE